MLSDDVFRARLQTTIACLRYWVPSVADAAHTEELEAEGFWKISVQPRTAGACPFELMFRSDRHFDITVGDETYEDLDISELDIFLPLVEAIADGRVIQRRRLSQATGAVRDVETIVTLQDGREWRQCRMSGDALGDMHDDAVEKRDRHFLAYRR